jgi:protein TonB
MGARRRPYFLIAVLGLHVVLVMLLTLQRVQREAAAEVITVSLSTVQDRSRAETPPAVPLRLSRPTDIAVPLPDVPVTPEPSSDSASLAPAASPVVAGDEGSQGLTTLQAADYLKNPLMPYPRESRRRHEQGTVLLVVLIGEDGLAKEVTMYRSSGYPSLDEAARQAVYTAVFRPFSVNGKPRATRVIAPFIFTLREAPAN